MGCWSCTGRLSRNGVRREDRADERCVRALVGVGSGRWEVVYVPGGPAVSWTGGNFASDGTEADESDFDRHVDEMRFLLL